MRTNSIIYSEFVQSPVLKDYVRGIWVSFLVSFVCTGVLWYEGVSIGWCAFSFLFLGPFNPHTLYALFIPWGIEFTKTTITLYYDVLFLKRSKTMNVETVCLILYDENTPRKTRLVLLAKESKGPYKTVTLLQRNQWSRSIQKRIVSYATNAGIAVLHY